MDSRKIEFHEEAGIEYEAAFEWYFVRSHLVASRFAAEVDRAIAAIAEAPTRWSDSVHGTRKFVLRRFPFAILYRELPFAIQVLAISHGHRRPSYWKNRL